MQKKVEVIKEKETIPDSDPDKKVKLAKRKHNQITISMVMLAMLGQPWRRSLNQRLHRRKLNYIVRFTRPK